MEETEAYNWFLRRNGKNGLDFGILHWVSEPLAYWQECLGLTRASMALSRHAHCIQFSSNAKTVKQILKKDFFKHFILHLIEKRVHLYAEPWSSQKDRRADKL